MEARKPLVARELKRSEKGLLLLGTVSGCLLLLTYILSPYVYFVVQAPRYLILHTLMEIASILVSFSVFIVNWEASKQIRNAHSLFVSTGFLTVAAVDTMHTLSYSGMPDLVTPNSVGKSVYFWVIARLWAVGVLWAAARIRPDSLGRHSRSILLVVNLLACAAIFLVVTLFQDRLPSMYVEGQGLTPLKVALEYAIIVAGVAACLAYLRAYRTTRDEALVLAMAALVISILSELHFILYQNASDLYNLLGHLYKVVAYYLLFRALLVSSLQRPYDQLQVAKARLEQTVSALDARNRELDALYDTAVTLSSTLKPSAVLEAAIQKVTNVMAVEIGAIFLLEEGTGRAKLAAWRGLTEAVVRRLLENPSTQSPGSPTRIGRHTVEMTALEDPTLVRSLGGMAARIAPLGVCACAQIVSRGSVVGTIAVAGREQGSLTSRDADLLAGVGYQLGLAIENARLYERTDERLTENLAELQKAERRSRFLAEVGELLGSSREMGQVLDLVAEKCAEVVGDWCAVYVLDERERQLRLEAIHHRDREELTAIRQVLLNRTIRVGEGLIGRVAQRGEPLLAPSLTRRQVSAEVHLLSQSLEDIAALRQVTPTSIVAAPLRSRGRTVGVLVAVVTHSEKPLGEADLSLVTELAHRTGTAIESSQLFQENVAQRRHLEAIITQMADGVVIADAAGRVLVVNTAAKAMLGDRINHLVGHELLPVRSRARGFGRAEVNRYPLLTSALAGELVMGEEISIGDGASERVLSASATPIRNESGEIDGAVAVLRDVTAERQVERMKDEFLATVSHELRTPITAVLGYTEMLLRGLRGPLVPRQGEALQAVRSAGRRLLALVNDILDISRLEVGKQELALERIHLHLSVERAVEAISLMAASKAISVVEDVPRGLPPVLADVEQLQRILGNLLSNAIKFTPQGGVVRISARLAGRHGEDGVAVTVTDDGIGIPVEHQERIWDKFYQVDSSSRRLHGGTGLGLAIARGLVELHGGKVWVESEGIPGKGSTFGFTLPVAEASPGC